MLDGPWPGANTGRVVIDSIGYLAGATTVAAFYCRTMLLLCIAATLANLLFILYGVLLDLKPIVILHALLLPLNVARLADAWRERVTQRGRSEAGRPA